MDQIVENQRLQCENHNIEWNNTKKKEKPNLEFSILIVIIVKYLQWIVVPESILYWKTIQTLIKIVYTHKNLNINQKA